MLHSGDSDDGRYWAAHQAVLDEDLARGARFILEQVNNATSVVALASAAYHGHTPLMFAVREGRGRVLRLLLQSTGVRRAINVVNEDEVIKAVNFGYVHEYKPTAMHYLLDEWRKIPNRHPTFNYTNALHLLLEAGASPFAGGMRMSALVMALELGITNAIRALLAYAPCGQLELAMLPLSAYPRDLQQDARQGTGILHAASRAGGKMVDRCRDLTKAAWARDMALADGTGDANLNDVHHWLDADAFPYHLAGLSIKDYPNLQDEQVCSREGVFKDLFDWHADTVSAIGQRLAQCHINAPEAYNEMDNIKHPSPLLGAILFCDVATATVLLSAGASPSIRVNLDGHFTTGLHMALYGSCDSIVQAMLTAAYAVSLESLTALALTRDSPHDRSPVDVAVTDRAMCLVTAAADGRPPVEAGCPAYSTVWHMRDRSRGNDRDPSTNTATAANKYAANRNQPDGTVAEKKEAVLDAREAEAAAIDETQRRDGAIGDAGTCGAGDHGCTQDTRPTPSQDQGRHTGQANRDWFKHTGIPPLMANMRDGGACDILEVNGPIDRDVFFGVHRPLRRPVLFRGAAANWPAASLWTKDYLAEKAGHVLVDVSAIPYGHKEGHRAHQVLLAGFLEDSIARPPVRGGEAQASAASDAAGVAASVCGVDDAAAKTQECVASDAEVLQCLRDGKDRCVCMRDTGSVKSCLGGCWESIEDVVCPDHAGKPSPASPPTAGQGTGESASRAPLYVFDASLMDELPALKSDLRWPDFFTHYEAGQSHQFILGPEGSGAPMHFHVEAFNAAFAGRRRWFIVPPSHNFWSRKPVRDWLATDYQAMRDNASLPLLECVQYPGDIMYAPVAICSGGLLSLPLKKKNNPRSIYRLGQACADIHMRFHGWPGTCRKIMGTRCSTWRSRWLWRQRSFSTTLT